MAINTQKVVVGGIGAGVVLAALDYIANGLLLAEQNAAALNALNPELAAGVEGTGMMIGYIVLDLVLGMLLVWTYAAMRPRFGAGPKTATMAGLQVWLVAILMYLGMTMMGMWAWSYFFIGSVVYLVTLLIASYVGGVLYKEE
ncbi:MAG: hypothetical protein PVH00_07175 [Gemmatimonadota bacterium]